MRTAASEAAARNDLRIDLLLRFLPKQRDAMQRGSCSGGHENRGPKNRPGLAQPAFTGPGCISLMSTGCPASATPHSREKLGSAALTNEWERALVDGSRVSSQSECGSLSAAQTATNVESTKTSENASTHAGAPTMAPALTRAKAVENRTISLTAADRVTEATGASFSTAIEGVQGRSYVESRAVDGPGGWRSGNKGPAGFATGPQPALLGGEHGRFLRASYCG